MAARRSDYAAEAASDRDRRVDEDRHAAMDLELAETVKAAAKEAEKNGILGMIEPVFRVPFFSTSFAAALTNSASSRSILGVIGPRPHSSRSGRMLLQPCLIRSPAAIPYAPSARR